MAVVCTVPVSVAFTATESGVSPAFATIEASSPTYARVTACISVTATLAPAVPPEPSAVVVTLTVVVAFSATAPDTCRLLAPSTAVIASLTTTVTATAASCSSSVSPLSAASCALTVTVEVLEAVMLVAVSVVPSIVTRALGSATTTAAPIGPRSPLEGLTGALAIACSDTTPAVSVAPLRSMSAVGRATNAGLPS